MDLSSKKVLFLDLSKKSSEAKSFPDLIKYIGGVGLGLRLYEMYQEYDPVIFSVGPLNGFFPFASKTSIVLAQENVIEDIYVGGYLSTRIRFSDLDAIVLLNRAEEQTVIDIENDCVNYKDNDIDLNSLGLPGKKSLIALDGEKVLVDRYFTPPENILTKNLMQKNVRAISITGTKTFEPPDMQKYEELYMSIMNKHTELEVEKGFFPSCSGCPMGCEKSRVGEMGGNLLAHSMTACGFAEKIYSDVGTVFSCLNVLGYDYTHEDIESLSELVQNTLRKIS